MKTNARRPTTDLCNLSRHQRVLAEVHIALDNEAFAKQANQCARAHFVASFCARQSTARIEHYFMPGRLGVVALELIKPGSNNKPVRHVIGQVFWLTRASKGADG